MVINMQSTINNVLGCIRFPDTHIDIDAGMFGILEEKLPVLIRTNPIPARNNVTCKCRHKYKIVNNKSIPCCTQDCRYATYGLQSGSKVSYMQKGKRM